MRAVFQITSCVSVSCGAVCVYSSVCVCLSTFLLSSFICVSLLAIQCVWPDAAIPYSPAYTEIPNLYLLCVCCIKACTISFIFAFTWGTHNNAKICLGCDAYSENGIISAAQGAYKSERNYSNQNNEAALSGHSDWWAMVTWFDEQWKSLVGWRCLKNLNGLIIRSNN